MPEVIPASLTFGFQPLRGSSKRSSGLSAEATDICTRVAAVRNKADGVITYLGPRMAAITALNNLIVESLSAKRHGEDAPTVSFASYNNARVFLSLLPASIPDPEVAIEATDGAISMEWYVGYKKLFAVSVGAGKRFAFAGLNGTEKVYGVSEFDEDDDKPPPALVHGVRSITG